MTIQEMAPQDERDTQAETVSPFKRILVALDASGHADRALAEALRLAGPCDGVITGIHAYAAQLHDRRFRQMEGGLPERYKVEEEMEYQRDVHDSLITKGLDIISDSYHDVAQVVCDEAELEYRRLSPEGKNYARLIDAVEDGDFQVLALGSIGLGAVPGSVVGTVCERVVRRSTVNTLVIRDADRAIGDGPIVVGLDGSEKSYGALMTAFEMGRQLGVEVHAVAAYDPYYHYVAFNKIADVLSDEAGKVFRFKEQEQLHEELIDDGIAKIYQSHLDVAERIAKEEGVDLTCVLLDGKPFKAIRDYLEKVNASLVMVGKVGVHADARLDIGGTSENLLRIAPCHVWLGQTEYVADFEVVADETISWSKEAEDLLSRAPEFARNIARKAVVRHAQETGHTFITKSIVEEVSNKLMPRGCPAHKDNKDGDTPVTWSDAAMKLVGDAGGQTIGNGIMLRAEKKARREGAAEVLPEHVTPFLDDNAPKSMTWAAAALARLSRVPEGVRDPVRERIEAIAVERGSNEVTMEIAEEGFAEGKKAMHAAMFEGGHKKTVDE